MSWQHHHRNTLGGQPLPAPDDGIVSSGHPPGRVGNRWERLLKSAPREAKDRLLRGRNYARRGRVRLLHISPGSATAEVVDDAPYHPSLRVRCFNRAEWERIIDLLREDLDAIASLLEGELPHELADGLERQGLPVMPKFQELSFDCDCGDYIMPCTHVAAVAHVLTDALDGDPFLLLTMRGRTRDHLMATLRAHWGDDQPLEYKLDEQEQAPPQGDWFSAKGPIPDFACRMEGGVVAAAGLRALGPPPGGHELLQTLEPLYATGASAAQQAYEAVGHREIPRRRPAPRPEPVPERAVEAAGATAASPAKTPIPHHVDLTEKLIDHLADHEGSTARQLANGLDVPISAVRREMVELEDLGIVYRRVGEGAACWWLG